MDTSRYVTVLVLLASLSNVEVSGIPYYDMDLNCGQSIMMSWYGIETGGLKLTSRSLYMPNMYCAVTIVAPSFSKRIMIYFQDLDIEYSVSCLVDSLQLFDGPSVSSPRLSGLNDKICGYTKPGGVYTTSSNTLTLLFTSDGLFHHRGFDAVFTAYHTGVCFSNEYHCSNGRCITKYLTCNGYNPCGDYSDCLLSIEAIAGIVIGCVAFVCFLIVVFILGRRRRRMRYARVPHVSVNETTGTMIHTPPPTYGAAQPGWNAPPLTYYPATQPPAYRS